MYRNVVSTRELLSDSFSSERHDQREYSQEQYSQLAYSQPEFSQISTQDMFTQQFSNGTQNEIHSQIPNKKPTLYDKWKSKTTTPFRSNGPEKSNGPINSVPSRPIHTPNPPRSDISFQQQLQINKVKAKERDDRDFLQQVVHTVQDCTKEVRLTLNSVKEKLEHDGDRSQQNLQQTISSFLDDLCKQQDRILNAVKEKDKSTSNYHELEKEIAVKEAKIKTLEKTVDEYKRETPEKIISAIQKQMRSPQRKVDDKLAELLETMRDNHEQYVRQIHEQKQQLEQQQQLYSELKKAQQTQVKDSEKRLISELSNLRKDIKKKESTCLHDILDQLKSAQEQQTEELERHMASLMEGLTQTVSYPKDQKPLKKEVQDLMKKHWDGVEKIVEAQFKKHLKLQEQQLSDAVEKMTEKESKDDQPESFLSLPQFEDKMGQYHEDFKKQVETLHQRHIQELKQLKSEMACKQEKKQGSAVQSETSRVTRSSGERFSWGSPDHAQDKPPKKLTDKTKACDDISSWRHESAIVSPLTANYKKLNTRSFFSKTAFSPVAAVLPQRNEPEVLNVVAAEDQPSQVINCQVKTVVKSKKKKKRQKKSRFSKPKKNKPQAPKKNSADIDVDSQVDSSVNSSSMENENEKPSPTMTRIPTSKVLPVSKSQELIATRQCVRNGNGKMDFSKAVTNNTNMSVYDFRDEDLSSQVTSKNMPFYGSSTQRYSYNSQKELVTVNTSQTLTFPHPQESPYHQDTMSRDSSPSLSITEMVVKRRIKCNKRTPSLEFKHINPGGFQKIGLDTQFPVYDILSTPTINTVSNKQQPFWQSMQQPQPQTVRRGTEKRKLCDVSLNDSILQCIQNQTKRICR